ncbi:hypothetical protein D3C76_1651340 [compost metagenome]
MFDRLPREDRIHSIDRSVRGRQESGRFQSGLSVRREIDGEVPGHGIAQDTAESLCHRVRKIRIADQHKLIGFSGLQRSVRRHSNPLFLVDYTSIYVNSSGVGKIDVVCDVSAV